MAGAFSGHLLNAFSNDPAGPSSSNIVTSGAMSFDARAHGTSAPPFSHSPVLFGTTPLTDDSATAKQIATLQAKLNKKLGPEYISQRPGPTGGPKLTYAEGWKIINLANEVFGFNGWSSNIVNLSTDFIDYSEESRKFSIGVTAIVRVTLRDGTYHEDVGYGMLENGKSKAAALDKCKKEAITDALKRTLRNFGNLLGNCLYDKSYTQEVVKIKVPPAKFDKSELYRRPEFEERAPDAPATVPCGVTETPSTGAKGARVKDEHEGRLPETPLITYVPRHLRQEITAAAQQAQGRSSSTALPQKASASGSGSETIVSHESASGALKPHGMVTPLQTPVRVQRPPPPRAPPLIQIATSPLARMSSDTERSVSFAEPMPMLAHAPSVDAADQLMHDASEAKVNASANHDDDDAFPLSTQEGAFFASVDLGEGDLGRPIDFDEGTGGVTMMDASELEQEPELDSPQPEPQVRDRTGSGLNTGVSFSVENSNVNACNEAQAQSVAKPPSSTSVKAQSNAWASGVPPSGPLNAASVSTSTSTPSTRTGSAVQDTTRFRPASVRGPTPGMKSPINHIPKPVAPACVRTTGSLQGSGPTNALKRSADVMQASSSARAPIQGMGLAQRQQHQQQQNTGACRLSHAGSGDGHDPKRFRR